MSPFIKIQDKERVAYPISDNFSNRSIPSDASCLYYSEQCAMAFALLTGATFVDPNCRDCLCTQWSHMQGEFDHCEKCLRTEGQREEGLLKVFTVLLPMMDVLIAETLSSVSRHPQSANMVSKLKGINR